jgi:hypothetical protein
MRIPDYTIISHYHTTNHPPISVVIKIRARSYKSIRSSGYIFFVGYPGYAVMIEPMLGRRGLDGLLAEERSNEQDGCNISVYTGRAASWSRPVDISILYG